MGIPPNQGKGTPTPERFAKMMEAELRAAGITAPIQLDAKTFILHIEGDKAYTMFLGNALAEYQQVPKGERRGVLRKYAGLTYPEKEQPLDEVRDNLLPRVRQRVFYHVNALRTAKPGESTQPFPYRLLSEYLAVNVVIDFPDHIQETFKDPREKWGVSIDELLEIGTENLRKRSEEPFWELEPGLWQSPWRDNHDASRLCITELIRSLRVKGNHVAIVPNRDTLLVTGSEDADGLALMAGIAGKEYAENRSISGIAVTLDGEKWNPFMVARGHPAFMSLRELRYRTLQSDYAEQTSALIEWHEKNEIDVFCAALQVFQTDEGFRSVAAWSEGAPTLLPVADEVAFMAFGPNEKPHGKPLMRGWDDVLRVVGHRMKLQDMYPTRYLVETFPSKKELTQLQ